VADIDNDGLTNEERVEAVEFLGEVLKHGLVGSED
jgi:hypothetical protein